MNEEPQSPPLRFGCVSLKDEEQEQDNAPKTMATHEAHLATLRAEERPKGKHMRLPRGIRNDADGAPKEDKRMVCKRTFQEEAGTQRPRIESAA